jgi:hypothetical protein
LNLSFGEKSPLRSNALVNTAGQSFQDEKGRLRLPGGSVG